MKVLKIIGITLLALVALILLIGSMRPVRFTYERSIEIKAPKEAIFRQVNHLKQWEKWGPWAEEDPSMQTFYGEQAEGAGAHYSWKSKMGNGKMTIAESTPPSSLKTALEFEGQGKAESWFRLEDSEGGATKTSWGMSFGIAFPFNAFTLFTAGSMEREMNRMFDKGLSNLKNLVEQENIGSSFRGYEIKTIDFPGKSFLTIRGKVKIGSPEMQQFYANSLGVMVRLIESKKIGMNGPPSSIYYDWNEQTGITDMAAAVPVSNGASAAGGKIQLVGIPAAKALSIDFYGNYDNLAEAHYAMDEYMKAHSLTVKPPVLEEYVTDPGTEPDTSKWLTKIYYFF